jgi:putative ABC transport system permease protein
MLFRALIFRPLRRDLGRTLLSLAAIALGVAVVVAIRVANRGAVASFQGSAEALAGGAPLLASGPAAIPAALLPRLFGLNDRAEFIPYLDRRAFDPAHRDSLEVLGLDLLAAPPAAAGPAAAPPPTAAAGPPPLWLASAYAAAHGLRAGGRLELAAGGRLRSFTIAGLLPASPLAPPDLAVLDLPDALAAFAPRAAPAFDGLRITLAPGASAAAVARALDPLLPAPDAVAPPAARVARQAQMLAAFRANLAALSYVSLLVGLFLIYNTVSISVVRRRLAIAAARALGATRGRVLGLFLAEGAVLALAGGAVGLGLGWLLAAGALRLEQRTVNNLFAAAPAVRAVLAPADAAWGLGLALAAGLLAAWAPARQAAGLRPAVALRAGGAETALRRRWRWAWLAAAALAAVAVAAARLPEPGGALGIPWFGFLSALSAVLACAALAPPLLGATLPRLRAALLRRGQTGWNASLGLAAASLGGALRRSSLVAVAVATAAGVLLGVAILVGSFRTTVQLWIGQQLRNDVFVRAADWSRTRPVPLDPGLVAALLATPGVGSAAGSHTRLWAFRGGSIEINTRWALRGVAALPEYRFLAGGPAEGADAVIVSEPFARRFALWPGDTFRLAGERGRMPLRVAGVYYDYTTSRGIVTLPPALYARLFGAPAVTELGLDAAPGVAPAALRRAVRLRLGARAGVVVNDNASLRAQAMAVFDQTFRITYALEAITLLVAILGVGNTLLAVVLERAREFAVLRFLGATRGQLRRLLLAEAGLLATLALVLGWAMAGALALVLVRVVNVQSFGWTIQFHWPWAYLASATALVWLATVAAGALPARSALRLATPAALEAE